MKEHHYFVAYTFTNQFTNGFNNCQISVPFPVKTFDDIMHLTNEIVKEIQSNVTILFFKEIEVRK